MTGEKAFRTEFSVKGREFSRAGDVSCRIKNLLKDIGIDAGTVRRLAIAAFEAEMNVIMYARQAVIRLAVTPEKVSILVDDEGPGIPDIEMAMKEGFSTATREMRELGFGAGMGLPNIRKNSDVFRLTSEPGRGTRLEITVHLDGSRT